MSGRTLAGVALASSRAVGNFLKFAVNLVNAKAVVEIGTGSGVGGLWLLSGMSSEAVLTTIDSEREHSKISRTVFEDADISPTRYRIITGKLIEVIHLPGACMCRPVIKGDHLYAAVLRSPSLDNEKTGFITILDKNNKVKDTLERPKIKRNSLVELRLTNVNPFAVDVETDVKEEALHQGGEGFNFSSLLGGINSFSRAKASFLFNVSLVSP